MIYTSGSTGRPKGVAIPHATVLNLFTTLDQRFTRRDTDTVLALTSISFDISVVEVLWALCRGARVVVPGEQAVTASLAAQAARHRPTLMQCTPSMMSTLVTNPRTVEALGSLETLVLAGEALPVDLARDVHRRFGLDLVNGYGPTEATVYASTHRVEASAPTVPIGRPVVGTSLFVLDRRFGLAPPGSHGELVIGGAGLSRGYHARPALTAERFCPDPWSRRPGGRLYLTGDLARFRGDGTLEYLGRLDHQVKLRGLRVELGEVETVLRRHPAVREAVVTAHGDPGGDQHLVAYAVPAGDGLPPVDELRGSLRETLPEFAVPSVFVELSALPLTPSGKVDRRSLPRPERSRPELHAEFRPPSTPAQEKIATVWREILELDKVGVDDNFFDLGGHSLQLPRVHLRLQEIFARELDMVELLEHPTIAALARNLERQREEPRETRQRSRERASKQKQRFKQFRRESR